MRLVVLAGGLGTRLQEETVIKPKPMVEIGGRPILWHILKHFAHYDFKDFLIALGYKGDVIKSYFHEIYQLNGLCAIDFSTRRVERDEDDQIDWRVNLVDTGTDTLTGGRVRRLRPSLERETFMVTYGDGVSDVPIADLVAFHQSHGKLATVTAVRPPARFGGLVLSGDLVECFTEKPAAGEGWINGGFMVFEPGVFDYLHGDSDSLESHALEKLAADGQLGAYRHEGFWQCMDTIRDKNYLESLWQRGNAPWCSWNRQPDAGHRSVRRAA